MNNDLIVMFPFICFFVFFFLMIILSNILKNVGTSNSKYIKFRKWSIVILTFGFVVLAIFGIKILINKTNTSSETSMNTSTADGFTIEEYKIIMDVNESNSIDVKEYITVNFYETGHHGIYRFIPTWLKYTNKDGITQSRQSKLSNLRAVGDNYTIDTVSGKKRIKIGDANYILPIGNHIYEIDYTYDMGFDPYDNYDEFIFHAFGDYWGTEIKNASITINLPKSFDSQNKVKFFADKYRNQDITSYINYQVNGNTINAKLSSNYRLNGALTIDVELPDGYFVSGSNNYGNTSLALCVLCIAFAIVSVTLWVKNGKNLDKVAETVEFYSPENLDAAEVGYLYKRDTGRKLTVALIIELASKGFIKIIESEDKTKQTIVKSNTTDINKYINRQIGITKLKEYKPNLFDIHYKATKIMKDYFPENVNQNYVTSNFGDFYKDSQYLIDNGFIRIDSDTINQYSEEQLKRIGEDLLLNEFKDKPKMTPNEEIVYYRLFDNSDETVLSENQTFYKAFNEIGEKVRNSYDDKINDLKAYKYKLFSSLCFLFGTLNFGLAYTVFEDLNPKLSMLYTIAFISNIVIFIFTILMGRKNAYGEQIAAKIKGFRNYIEVAEKNQLEMLVEQNPNYFYDILPYAYVLDVSKKWIEKFENIPIPNNDMGNFDYYNINSIDSLASSVYVPSSSSSSSSGCSSCGGGCSSCGGGCSSCGGGGSW